MAFATNKLNVLTGKRDFDTIHTNTIQSFKRNHNTKVTDVSIFTFSLLRAIVQFLNALQKMNLMC